MRRTSKALLIVGVLAAFLVPRALAQAPSPGDAGDRAAITQTLERYFTAFDALDAELLRAVLHPEAVYTGGVGLPSVTTSLYEDMLVQLRKASGKGAPPSSNAVRTVTGITVHGRLGTALVRVEYRAPSRAAGSQGYEAYQLYKAGGGWQIVSGVMQPEPHEGPRPPASPKIRTAPPTRPTMPDERKAVLAAVDAWWKAHDADEAAALQRVLAPGARSWYEDDGAVQFLPYSKEIDRINSGRSHAGTRPAPGERRSVADLMQESGVAMVTTRVEIPKGARIRRSFTTFQLYKTDDRWLVVNLAGYNEPEVREDRREAGPTEGLTGHKEVRNGLGMRFVEIPAGGFDMGADKPEWERPIHRVHVKTFWLGVTEVTQAQWQTVMGNNPSYFKEAGPNAPVEMVSWKEAQAFIARLNALDPGRRYRLPSEAEWEYACRAGSTDETYGPWAQIAWVQENSGGTTHPVASKRPNAFGLYDMLGNVTEWAQDTYRDGYEGAPADGSARVEPGVTQHTLRGGGWDLPSFFLHAGIRGPYDPIHRLGFRVAFDPAPGDGR